MKMNIKKILASFIASLAILLFAGVIVFADAPTVTITPIGTLSYATFPVVYNVAGTVTHGSGDNGLNPVNDVNLYINDIFESMQAIPNGDGSTFNFSLPWNITGPGTYAVKVKANHGDCPNTCTGSDEETVVVESTVVITECKAAPAIAAELLRDHNVKPKVISAKNYISKVAQHMGPQTDFDTVSACSEAAYRAAVDSYLDNILGAY